MRLDKYSGIDPYTYPNGVLKNKHHIQDEKLLEELERITVATRIIQLRENPIKGKFDLAHLRKIHRHLFQDIYDWAGKIRTVDISKGDSRFCSYHLIQSYCETIAKKFKQQQWSKNISPEQFSEQAAYFLGEYNAVHPFREGNGRAIREMIGQLAKQNGYDIHWENITQEQMIKASEVSTTLGNNQLLKQLILENIQVSQSEQQQNLSVLTTEERLTQAQQLFKNKVKTLSPVERNKILAYEKGASEIWERLPEKERNALATNFYINATRDIDNGAKIPPAMSNAAAKNALENRRLEREQNIEPDIDDDMEIDR